MDMESSGASTGAAAAVSSSDVASSTGSSRTTGGADPARDAAAARKEREGRAAAAALRAAQDADPAYAGLSKNARKKLARKQNADVDWRERKRQKKTARAGGAGAGGGGGAGVPHTLIALAKAMAVRELGKSYETCTLREWNAATHEAKFQTNNAPRACPRGAKGHGAATTTNGFILKIEGGVVWYNCAYTSCQHQQKLGSYAATAQEVFIM